MNTTNPTLDDLNEIKNSLENKMSESSDSTDSTYEPSDDSSTSSSSKSPKRKSKKSSNYKEKYNKLESKIRYMQLEMVNKEIELTEIQQKLINFNKNEEVNKKINFLFERLDNAYKILTERINTIEDTNYIKYKTITSLISINESCTKVKDKYSNYLNNELIPIMSSN